MINIEINPNELLQVINYLPTILGFPTLAKSSFYLAIFLIVSALFYRGYKVKKDNE